MRSRRLILSFVLLLLLPAATVVWLGVQLIARDRVQESNQLRDRRESASDRLIGSLQQKLLATERKLAGPANSVLTPADDDSLVVVFHHTEGAGFEAFPKERLLYYPMLPTGTADTGGAFAEGEVIEYIIHDYLRAARLFRDMSTSKNPAIRAGALLRSARNWKKAGNSDEAFRVYDKLAEQRDIRIDGVPADLVARRARCALLKELGRVPELQNIAHSLQADLFAPRWVLDRGTFQEYAAEFDGWLGVESAIPPDREALSEATAWLWQQPGSTSGQTSRQFGNVGVAILWQPDGDSWTALIAGPHFQQREWFDGLQTQFDSNYLQVALAAADDKPLLGTLPADLSATVRRGPSETHLPWTIFVSNANAAAAQFAGRRNMMVGGLAILIALVIAGGYFALRAMSREFEVARLQSDFVSSVSHEFRTPLTSLRQFTDLLTEDDNVPIEKRRSFYQAQGRAAERLQRLVESLLDFGRMEAGAHPYRLERISAAALVRGVLEDFESEMGTKGFVVESAITEDSCPVDADPDALARALWNLLDNAVKYSGDSRTIWVETARQNGEVDIRVRDRGLGIPRHEQSTIFRKFVRGSDARIHGIKGTGIGLAMVRHIISGHGGEVHVESSTGKGSTFTIVLPWKG
jgi:signal transduction histidine kinase